MGIREFVAALVTVVGNVDGFGSASFAIATVFAFLVIRDALGLRRIIGTQGLLLKSMIAEHGEKQKRLAASLPSLVGHSLSEVIIGCGVGIAVAFAGMLL